MPEQKVVMIPAIPPDDYKGGIGNWIMTLIEYGFWDGINPKYYKDLMIPDNAYWEMVNKLKQSYNS